MEVGEHLHAHVRQQIQLVLGKYFDQLPETHVVFKTSAHIFICDLVVHLHHHLTIRCESQDNDAYHCFDGVLKKLDERIKRYRTRIRNQHRIPKEKAHAMLAKQYVVDTHQEDTGEDIPLIIADMCSELRSMTVGEAVMQLDLTEQSVLVFQNTTTAHLNVVYRRRDGHIGWIDPHLHSKNITEA